MSVQGPGKPSKWGDGSKWGDKDRTWGGKRLGDDPNRKLGDDPNRKLGDEDPPPSEAAPDDGA